MIRNYSNNAVETSLATGVNDTATSMTVLDAANWPAAPFTILVDPDTPNEEVCLVTARTNEQLTVDRGFDGTTGLAHSAGAVVKHAAVALDFREANQVAQGGLGHGTWQDLLP